MSSLVNNAKEDIIYFKDEVLRDVKKFEAKINQKIDSQTITNTKKLEEYDIKMAVMTQKISEFENKLSSNISLIKKVEELSNFKIKTEQDAMVQEVRIETIENDLKNAINKYDAILLESVIYSGVIGKGAKFNTFHELIDFLLNSISNLNLAKEKSIIDIKSIKKKYDSIIEVIKSQINSNSKTIKEVNKKLTEHFENKFKLLEEDITGKFVELRMTNNKYANELKDRADKLTEIYKQMEKLREDIEKKVKSEIDRIINIPGEVNQTLNAFQDDMENINNQFLELSEFVKNYKFDAKKIQKEGKDEETKIDRGLERRATTKRVTNMSKGPYKIQKPISLLKQYINGEISYEVYTQKSKLQLHKREEGKEEENKINNKKNELDSKLVTKKRVMSLASQAEIVVIDNNTNLNLNLNNDYEVYNNPIKQEMKENIMNSNITKIKRKPKINENEKELNLNNANKTGNNDMDKMIKQYNFNQKKTKKSVETSNKANNTSFQDYENSSNKIDEIVDKEFYFNKNNYSANSSPKRSSDFNEDEKNKSNDNKNFSNSLYLEGNKYFQDTNFFGSGTIEVISYNKKREKGIKDKKMDLLEYIRRSYDEQEINDEKKLDQLNNAINFSKNLKQINNMNRINNFTNSKEFFNNTLSNPMKKNSMKKIFNKKIFTKNARFYNNNDNQSLSIGFMNEKKNDPTNIISLEKINLNNMKITNRKIHIENPKVNSKMLNPIKLKGSKSCTNITQLKKNENEILNNRENKIGQLVDKIKDMIPYEEKISFFETSNIDNLNKNVFSKKKIYFEKKEENYEIKSLPMKKLNSIYHREAKMKNNNNSKNLINEN